MPTKRDAKSAGREAVAAMRRQFAKGVAAMIKANPDRAAAAVETGLVSKAWLEDPGNEKLVAAAPTEVVERFLEREVEQRPSALSQLGLSAVQILSWRSAANGDDGGGSPERVAIAFTDLVGFTAFTNANGDEAARAILTEHYRRSGPVVRSRGGRIVKRLGDGLLISFPEPEAAVLACLELAEAAPQPLELRAGVHVGEVAVLHEDIIGNAVNVAARVTEDAKPGEVLVTGAVCEAIGDLPGVTLGRTSRRNLKGIAERVPVCSVRRG